MTRCSSWILSPERSLEKETTPFQSLGMARAVFSFPSAEVQKFAFRYGS